MKDLLTYAEEAGMENLRFRIQNSEVLAKEAASTLTIILAGMGGSLAYAAKGLEHTPPSSLVLGAAALALWLMIVGCLLVVFCMLTTELQVPTNEPTNLYQAKYSIEKIRIAELKNIQARIEKATMRNQRVAVWLDRCRLLFLASPLIFAIPAFFS
ncbi:MAG: hypothetical protein KZQ99_02340 [Candidatus Thiodiazotropha sp. (ex Dulcina madagascariensis)]|nr:hypothetical protein [Candidatus Thiodiazotropha sp. (ex Dulcina madagascariensis)]